MRFTLVFCASSQVHNRVSRCIADSTGACRRLDEVELVDLLAGLERPILGGNIGSDLASRYERQQGRMISGSEAGVRTQRLM